MTFADIMNMVFPIGFLLVIIALVWFIVELVFTVRRTRSAVVDVQKQLEPTLENVQEITANLKPVVAKVDPLVERVSLTVDAANLEIMRLDQILEDVNQVTDTISNAANAVDAAASAPLELVNNVTSRVRNVLKPRHASEESIALGQSKVGDGVQNEAPAAKSIGEDQAHRYEKKAERQAAAEAKREVAHNTNKVASHVAAAVAATATADADSVAERYFTYDSDSPKKEAGPVTSTSSGETAFSEMKKEESEKGKEEDLSQNATK